MGMSIIPDFRRNQTILEKVFDKFNIIQAKWVVGSIWMPLLRRVPLTGKELWHNCQRKTLILGVVLIFHFEVRCGWTPWANHVAVLVENSPELFRPQQIESSRWKIGNLIPIIFWTMGWWLSVDLSSLTFQSPVGMINSLTFKSRLGMTKGSMPVIFERDRVSTQLSTQKEIFSPCPTFQMRHCWSRSQLFRILFQTVESVVLRV